MQTSPGVEVKTQCTAADHGDRWDVSQPGRERGSEGLVKARIVTACNVLWAADWEMA